MESKNEQRLTSVFIQPKIDLNDLNVDLFGITVCFGKKKSDKFSFGLVFDKEKNAKKLYDELILLKGKTRKEVAKVSESLYDKYKKLSYKRKNVLAPAPAVHGK